jgi:predicted kinase
MPIAHLIHGYIGAGKTTFARRLEAEHSAIRFTLDEWMHGLYGEDPPEAEFADYAERVRAVMESVWPRCLTLGVDVILDFGFWSRRERDRVRGVVAALGAEARLYHLACPPGIAWERIEKRNQALGSSLYIARNTFEVLKGRFEPLGTDEARIEVTGEGPAATAG